MIKMAFANLAEGVSRFQNVTGLAIRSKVPTLCAIKGERILAAGNEISTFFLQPGQRPLQAVKHTADQTWPEFDR